jgi:para-nitrobenzyl esterase
MGAKFTAEVDCGDASDVATCLRKVPTATLVKKAGSYLSPMSSGAIGPIANGTTLPASAAKIFAEGVAWCHLPCRWRGCPRPNCR